MYFALKEEEQEEKKRHAEHPTEKVKWKCNKQSLKWICNDLGQQLVVFREGGEDLFLFNLFLASLKNQMSRFRALLDSGRGW